LFLRGHFGIKEIASHLDSYEVEIRDILNGLCHEVVPDFSNQKSKAGWYEYNMYMQNQLLRDADAMSMAHGVEIRVPFLDHQLVKGVLSMPENQRFKEGIPKQLLVDAFKEILPEHIWNRKKMGFSFPFSEWLKNNEMVNDLMNKTNQPNKNHIQDFESGKMSWSCFLILMLLRKNGKI
jgi:asparagine synthase (glutamine-hydrolysing)